MKRLHLLQVPAGDTLHRHSTESQPGCWPGHNLRLGSDSTRLTGTLVCVHFYHVLVPVTIITIRYAMSASCQPLIKVTSLSLDNHLALLLLCDATVSRVPCKWNHTVLNRQDPFRQLAPHWSICAPCFFLLRVCLVIYTLENTCVVFTSGLLWIKLLQRVPCRFLYEQSFSLPKEIPRNVCWVI